MISPLVNELMIDLLAAVREGGSAPNGVRKLGCGSALPSFEGWVDKNGNEPKPEDGYVIELPAYLVSDARGIWGVAKSEEAYACRFQKGLREAELGALGAVLSGAIQSKCSVKRFGVFVRYYNGLPVGLVPVNKPLGAVEISEGYACYCGRKLTHVKIGDVADPDALKRDGKEVMLCCFPCDAAYDLVYGSLKGIGLPLGQLLTEMIRDEGEYREVATVVGVRLLRSNHDEKLWSFDWGGKVSWIYESEEKICSVWNTVASEASAKIKAIVISSNPQEIQPGDALGQISPPGIFDVLENFFGPDPRKEGLPPYDYGMLLTLIPPERARIPRLHHSTMFWPAKGDYDLS